MKLLLFLFFPIILFSQEKIAMVPQWATHEITLTSAETYENPYIDVEVWALFVSKKGDTLKRPAFWDGQDIWKIRFAPTDADGVWSWESYASNLQDKGLNGRMGKLRSPTANLPKGMNAGKNGLGWWQGEEAWMQLMHGGTMGVVYGAATLWQWKISPTEEGWPEWTDQPTSWKEAMHMKGSIYVGLIGKILGGLPMADIEKRWGLANGTPLLAKDGELYVSFLNEGGEITIKNLPQTLNYTWINPKTGDPKQFGKVTGTTFKAPDNNPWVLLIKK